MSVKDFSITIPPEISGEMAIFGNFVNFYDATADFKVEFSGSGDKLFAAKGTVYKFEQGKEFSTIRIHNESEAEITVSFIVAIGSQFEDNRLVSSSTATITVDNLAPANFIRQADFAVADSTVTQIWTADANTTEVFIQNLSDDNEIRIGDDSVSASSGIRLKQQQDIVLACSADLYAYHEAGVPVDVAVNGLKRSAV